LAIDAAAAPPQLATAHNLAGKLEAAAASYSGAARAFPRSADVLFALATVQLRQKLLQQGADTLGRALELDPAHAQARALLAQMTGDSR
jgi:cytochrome c-type biogenesis protein CcmH/NrfG